MLILSEYLRILKLFSSHHIYDSIDIEFYELWLIV